MAKHGSRFPPKSAGRPAGKPSSPPPGRSRPPQAVSPRPGEDGRRGQPTSEAPQRNEVWIYGYHPVAAALANPERKILRLLATDEVTQRLKQDASIPADSLHHIHSVARRDIDTAVGEDAVHQGLAVLTRPLGHDLHSVLESLEGKANAVLVVLDQVTDPHNVGAILRSAAAFGASAVIAPDRHAPEETGAMAKSASGALDKIPYVKTVNLVRALEIIKEFQFWLVGLDAGAPQHLADVRLDGRIALVLGAEGEGIRRLVAETCDHLAQLPISHAMESLNVSNAAAIALYEKARQNRAKG